MPTKRSFFPLPRDLRLQLLTSFANHAAMAIENAALFARSDARLQEQTRRLEALAVFNTEYIDLVIMDLMMPHMDGMEAIRRIRQSSLVPIIVLSALGEEQNKVQALNIS